MSRFAFRISVACLLAVGAAFVAGHLLGRWSAPKPPPGCPHVHDCPFCAGWDSFHAGQAITDNPFPAPPDVLNDRSQPRHQWAIGWAAAQREAGE
jgi:hypothetical protein